MTPPAIKIKDLRVDYGSHVAVDGVDLEVSAGEICGLVGPNGAGKSSTFRVAATLLQPTYGSVALCGIDIRDHADEARKILGYMPDLAPVASDLYCWEFLDLFAAAHGLTGAEKTNRVADCLESVRLTDKRAALCKSLSRGMMQRLVLAKTLLHNPKILLLDEPASGMDPMSRIELRQTVRTLAAQGATVLISSHILTELADMCTSVAIMRQGKLLAVGSMQDISARLRHEKRELRLTLLSHVSECAAALDRLPGVSEVCATHEEIRCCFSGDPAAQAALLRTLIEARFPIRSFEEKSRGIEQLVMELGLN